MPEAASPPDRHERVISIIGSCVVSSDITANRLDRLADEIGVTIRNVVFTEQIQVHCEEAHPIDERMLWPLELWLNQETTETTGNNIHRMYNVLQGFGLTVLRDVLGAGQRIPSLHRGSVALIQKAVDKVEGVTWESKPPMTTIAKMYWGSNVVPAFFVSRAAILGISSVRDLADSSIEGLERNICLGAGRDNPSADDRRAAIYLHGQAVDYLNKLTEAKKIVLMSS